MVASSPVALSFEIPLRVCITRYAGQLLALCSCTCALTFLWSVMDPLGKWLLSSSVNSSRSSVEDLWIHSISSGLLFALLPIGNTSSLSWWLLRAIFACLQVHLLSHRLFALGGFPFHVFRQQLLASCSLICSVTPPSIDRAFFFLLSLQMASE